MVLFGIGRLLRRRALLDAQPEVGSNRRTQHAAIRSYLLRGRTGIRNVAPLFVDEGFAERVCARQPSGRQLVSLPILNLAEARFECTYGHGCDGICCRNGRPPIYPDDASRIDAKLPEI